MHQLNFRIADLAPSRRRLLDQWLTEEKIDPRHVPILPQSRHREDFPVSLSQQRLWFLDRLQPGNAAYNLSAPVAIDGDLHIATLEASLAALVRRHGSLRTVFQVRDGEPRQRLMPATDKRLPMVDLSALPEAEAEARRLVAWEGEQGFDLARGPLLRLLLLRMEPEKHILLFTMHHIISDGWSQGLFIQEAGALYQATRTGRDNPLPEAALQFVDFAAWQRRWVAGGVLEEQIEFWRRRLAGAPGSLELPTDFPRPAQQSHRGEMLGRMLPEAMTEGVQSLAQGHLTTPFVVLLTVFKVLLSRLSGQKDLVVGTPVAGRQRAEVEGMIGFFINSLMLRSDLAGRPTFTALLERVREGFLEAHEHQDVPFEKLVAELAPPRDRSRTPFFQVFFNMLNLQQPTPAEVPDLSLRQLSSPHTRSMFDLTLYVAEHGGRLNLSVTFCADLFLPERMERMLAAFEELLGQVLKAPQLPIAQYALPGVERVERPGSAWDEGALLESIAEQKQLRGERTALVAGEQVWSRSDLEMWSTRLAAALQEGGVGPGDAVAVYATRRAELVLALLAIAKAGASWLVLDAAYPAARLCAYVEQVKPRAWVRLGDEEPPSSLLAAIDELSISCRLRLPEDLPRLPDAAGQFSPDRTQTAGHIMFTSGSTGQPRAVVSGLEPLAHFVDWQSEQFSLGPSDRFSVLSGLAHDPLLRDLFTPLCCGATLCIPEPELLLEPRQLRRWLEDHKITVVHLTPSLARSLAAVIEPADAALTSVRHVFFGGEPLLWADVEAFARLVPKANLVNFYGATETPQAVAYSALTHAAESGGDAGSEFSSTSDVSLEARPESPACGGSLGQILQTRFPRRPARRSNSVRFGRGSHRRQGFPAVPLGQGIRGVELVVLTTAGTACGFDELGEICVRSPHLSRGYLGKAAATAATFVPDPKGRGDRLYRTGDLGRLLPSGAVLIAARKDRQLKIRGVRVEPREVESTLLAHPEVRSAAVVARPAPTGEDWLVAYLVVDATEERFRPQAAELWRWVARGLPESMVPSRYVFLDALPRTPNGKLDRDALPDPREHAVRPAPQRGIKQADGVVAGESEGAEGAPRDEQERYLSKLWGELLGLDEVGVDEGFFELGGHSLLATRMMDSIRREFGMEVPLRTLFDAPTVAQLSAAITAQGHAASRLEELPTVVPDLENRSQPFPLTDIQEAYWVGRSEAVEMGNVASHRYLEFEIEDLDLDLFGSCWQRLVNRHDMLRAVILDNGTQRILPEVPPYEIAVSDLRALPETVREERLETTRHELSHQILEPGQWPLFEIRASLAGGGRCRLHLSFDYLLADAASFDIMLRELVGLYRQPELELGPLELSFRDYVLAQKALESSALYERSREYWLERVPNLPAAPDLPRLSTEEAEPKFLRRTGRLPRAQWITLRERARKLGLTPSGVLLAAFGEILARWCREPRFTLVLTLFHRLPVHPQVDDLVGDFTTTSLLAIDAAGGDDFTSRALRVQQRLWDDLDHRYFSGVQVLRALARQRGSGLRAIMPVVFTSTLDLDERSTTRRREDASLEGGGRGEKGRGAEASSPISKVFGISQTPQVWLDHQVFEEDGDLCFNWDAVDSLFPEGLLDEMFASLGQLLGALADQDESWQLSRPGLLPSQQAELLAHYNQTEDADLAAAVEGRLLHHPFEEEIANGGDRLAVITEDESLTYSRLAARVTSVVEELRAVEVRAGTLVAVVMDKGWQQVAAVLAILRVGAAYLPIDPTLPEERRDHLLERGRVEVALTQAHLAESLAWPAAIRCRVVRGVDSELVASDDEQEPAVSMPARPEDLAYVIFTSGSTGQPKGVAIEHHSALNTVLDINRRFAIGPDDRVFALSSLSFDLSVYDVFGLLGAGGALVLPAAAQRRDPAAWVRLLEEHQVTVWNSVPALMEMLVEFLEARPELCPRSLRLVMMSGDWIPTSLPARIQALFEGVEVVSLGGATEASIWSILYPITDIPASWSSVPYGAPLSRQGFHVLDSELETRPVGVPGELYISGVGLAREYWRDPEKTAASFIIHPKTGERLYRTGDLGRMLPAGVIEFLGREDNQVKVQGYRIELGEIESALAAQPQVAEAVLVAVGEQKGAKRLMAFLQAVAGEAEPPTDQVLREFLGEKLPSYMVPSAFRWLSSWPLTANGKVDRKALLQLAAEGQTVRDRRPVEKEEAATPRADPARLAQLEEPLRELLKLDEIDTESSLLDLGASSVDLVRVANLIETELGHRPAMEDLFHLPIATVLAGGGRRVVHEEAAGGDSNLPRWQLLRDPEERDRFKKGQPGLRLFGEAQTTNLTALTMDDEERRRLYVERRSRRRFASPPVSLESLSRLLGNLQQMSWGEEPKYRYASAGGLYPVQVYVYAKPGRVENLAAGTHYYHPVEHVLYTLDESARLQQDLYGWVNRSLFEEAAFGIFLIGRLSAIGPMYADLSRDFCLLEAGLMSQLLDTEAPRHGLGLCQVGQLDFERVRHAFQLEGDHIYLYHLLGGGLHAEEEAEARARPLGEPTSSESEPWEEGEL